MSTASMHLDAPANYADELHELVTTYPGARLQDDGGLMVRRFTVTAPDGTLEALRPKLEAWLHDVASREAW